MLNGVTRRGSVITHTLTFPSAGTKRKKEEGTVTLISDGNHSFVNSDLHIFHTSKVSDYSTT